MSAGTPLLNASAHDTIAAIATPPGQGGIGIVRVSGPAAAGVAAALLGSVPPARVATLASFHDSDGAPLDAGLALWFPAPHSYTGEDVLELQAHGSPAVLQRLLERAVEAGARRAGPGEFTQRAYLNERLDLLQAEAVADLIAAGSLTSALAASRSLRGEFSRRVGLLTTQLLEVRALAEALLDFPDERDVPVSVDLAPHLAALLQACRELRAAARVGARLTDAPHVVLAGRANAGKSSLLNALSGEEAAIVTPVPGTTRDVLRIEAHFHGVRVVLTDTAGLRDSEDLAEREGVRRAGEALRQADLVLYVVDAADAAATHSVAGEILGLGLPSAAPLVVVWNKVDLLPDKAAAVAIASATAPATALVTLLATTTEAVRVSATTGAGLAELRAVVGTRLGLTTAEAPGTFSARARHVEALERAEQCVLAAVQTNAQDVGAELVAEDLRLAQMALEEVTGRVLPDEVLAAVFSRFCIGK